MWFLVLGLALAAMKWLLYIEPVASWPWYAVLSPFAMAIAWWSWADWSGFTKRKAMERENTRKQARIDKQREQMGMLPRKKR
ncbi:MAG: TIGR04438 family Trp-rich protein [Burkholderiales bacterium]|nr:TIGR04438 family Trp-rich protein [Burkholderiales bacterium]